MLCILSWNIAFSSAPFLKSKGKDLYLKPSSWRKEVGLLVEEGVWMRVHLPRWVERNDYLVQKWKAGSKIYLVPVLSVTRPELNSIYGGKRTKHLMLFLTMELYCIYLGSMLHLILDKVGKQIRFFFSSTKYLGA